jgi:hypothetical protein
MILYWLLLVSATFVVYWPALNSFFLSDDFSLIHSVRENGAFGIWTQAQQPFLRPLISLSFFCDYQFWKLNATGYHLSNIFVHVLNGMLVSYIAYLLLTVWQGPNHCTGQERKIAFLAGVFFLVLPSHAEAVTWISGRTDVIAAFFALSSLAAYLIYRLYGHIIALCFSLVLFAFALASKESVFALPLVLLSFDLFTVKTRAERTRAWLAPMLFVGAIVVYLLLRRMVLGTFTGGYSGNIAPATLIKNFASFVAASYLPRLPSISYYAGTFTVILVMCVAQLIKRKSVSSLLVWSTLAFVLSALPALYTAMIVGGIHADGQNERFIYLPSAFSCIGLPCLISFLLHRRHVSAAAALVLIVFSVQTYHSNLNWRVAGDVSQRLLASFQSLLPARNVILLTVPDTIKGAYVYRNGFEAAATLFYEGKFKQVTVVSIARFWNPEDTVPLLSNSELMHSLHLPNPAVYRTPSGTCGLFDYRRSGVQFKAALGKSCSLRVQLMNVSSQDRIALYSGGQLITPSRTE